MLLLCPRPGRGSRRLLGPRCSEVSADSVRAASRLAFVLCAERRGDRLGQCPVLCSRQLAPAIGGCELVERARHIRLGILLCRSCHFHIARWLRLPCSWPGAFPETLRHLL